MGLFDIWRRKAPPPAASTEKRGLHNGVVHYTDHDMTMARTHSATIILYEEFWNRYPNVPSGNYDLVIYKGLYYYVAY